jgi:hypothetical protein
MLQKSSQFFKQLKHPLLKTNVRKISSKHPTDFRKIVENKLPLVDKSPFIGEALDIYNSINRVDIIGAPPGTGKTSILSMLNYFLVEYVNKQRTRGLFDHLKIGKSHDYMIFQGKYAAIFFTLKTIYQPTFKEAYEAINQLFNTLYTEHSYLLKSEKLSDREKHFYESVLKGEIDWMQFQDLLRFLIQCVSVDSCSKPWVLIDAYDAPIQGGYNYNYTNQIMPLMRNIFRSAFKENPYLGKAVMMGVSGIEESKEIVGINDLKFHSALDPIYGKYFAFDESEVDYILRENGLFSKSKMIKSACLNHYQIDKKNFYHPSLVMHFIYENEMDQKQEKRFQAPALRFN